MSQRKSGTRRFGTNAVTGLNVSTAPHLIADHELTQSSGGWTDHDGSWRTGRNHVTVHSGSAISTMAVGRMGGQDHTVYVDGNGIYDTGSLVGTVTMGASPRVVPIDRKFLVLGAADGKNKVYDGNHVRDQGPWQPDYMACQCDVLTALPTSGWSAITAATKANPCVLTIGTHKFQVGNYAYISGIVGMTQLNDKFIKVVAIGATTISLDVDSTAYTTWTSGGYADPRFNAAGSYKWGITNIIELSDGTVLESKMREIVVVDGDVVSSRVYPELSPSGAWESNPVSVEATDKVTIGYDWTLNSNDWKAFLTLAAGALYNITGTQGTDWIPGIRLYRTKADGTDFYLEREYNQGDAHVSTFSDATGSGLTFAQYFSNIPDVALGALYTPGNYDHGSPPESSLAAQCGQRVFLNDVDNPERVYVSGLDGSDYYSPTDWLLIPANVTALNRVRDRLVVGSAMRWYLVDMISGFPQVQELDTSVGVLEPQSVSVNDQGLFFMRPNGAYHLDLSKTTKISRKAAQDTDLAEGQASLVTADVAIFVADPQEAGSTLVANIRDGGWIWHTARGVLQHTHLSRNSQGQILGALPTKIESLFLGTEYYGQMVGKVFSDGETYRTIRLLLDVECTGGASIAYNVNTNYGSVFAGVETYTLATTYRRIVEVPLARTVAETFQLTMVVVGNLTLYGYAIEVEAP